MSEDAGVFDRPLGLMGIWGNIIYAWLDELLPLDVVSSVNDEVSEQLCCTSIKFFYMLFSSNIYSLHTQLHILVTPVPSFGKTRVSQFHSREDLIKANMASVHLVSNSWYTWC